MDFIVKGLSEDPLEKVLDDKIEAWDRNEEVWGTIQCQSCNFWGRMEGIIEAADKRFIKFVCPECNSLERVRNNEHMQ